jgi:hypothetical protein
MVGILDGYPVSVYEFSRTLSISEARSSFARFMNSEPRLSAGVADPKEPTSKLLSC